MPIAKELPYFKFEPSTWDTGSIQMCTREERSVFIDLCSMYWQRLGDLPYKLAVQKVCAGNATALDSLCGADVIKIIDGMICIDFLNEQLAEFENTSSQNAKNAREGWQKRRKDATAERPHSDPNAIREEKIRLDEKREEEIREEEKLNTATKVATIENRRDFFMQKVAEHLPQYGKEMLREFFDYWTEMNEGGRKMRFEMQKVFDVKKRLTTWSKNNKFNGQAKSVTNEIERAKQFIAARQAAKGAA